MRFQKLGKIGASFALGLLLGTPLVAAVPNNAASATAVESTVNWYAPGRVSTLLQDFQAINARLATNGETLGTFARSPQHSWQSHAHYLNAVRDQVNDAGKILSELQSIRHGALAWQQLAIDRIHPVALDLAAHTEAAISYLTENQGRLFVTEYRDHLAAIADRTSEMRTTINNFVDYGDAQQKLKTLGQTLEIAGS